MGEDVGGASDSYDPHADPKTDPRERRRIRYEYRELISDTQRNRHEFIRPQSTGLHKALDKAENLFNQVTLTREAVLDSHFLVVAANLGSQQAQQLQTHLITFDSDVFVEKLITFMGGRNIANTSREDEEEETTPRRRQHSIPKLDWMKLGQKACVLFRRIPSIDFMLGPLSMEAPANRKPRKDAQSNGIKKPDSSQKVIPSELEKVEAQEESTTKEVNRIYQVLFANTVSEDEDIIPICLFKFIINPHSFSQTIENLFHLSFLVKDGRAKIILDNSGLPLVAIEDMPGEEDQPEKHQVVVHLTLQEYKEIIRTFDITESVIPPRQHIHRGAGPNHGNQNNQDDAES